MGVKGTRKDNERNPPSGTKALCQSPNSRLIANALSLLQELQSYLLRPSSPSTHSLFLYETEHYRARIDLNILQLPRGGDSIDTGYGCPLSNTVRSRNLVVLQQLLKLKNINVNKAYWPGGEGGEWHYTLQRSMEGSK